MLEVLGALRLTEVGTLAVVDALDWSVRERVERRVVGVRGVFDRAIDELSGSSLNTFNTLGWMKISKSWPKPLKRKPGGSRTPSSCNLG